MKALKPLYLILTLTAFTILITTTIAQEKPSMSQARENLQQSITSLSEASKMLQVSPFNSPVHKLERAFKEINYLLRTIPDIPQKEVLTEIAEQLAQIASEIEETQNKLRQQIIYINDFHSRLADKIQYCFVIAIIKEEVKAGKYKEAANELTTIQKFFERKKAEQKEEAEATEGFDLLKESEALEQIASWLSQLNKFAEQQGKESETKEEKFPLEKFDEFLKKLETRIIQY